MNLNTREALTALVIGKKLTRKGWGPEMYIELRDEAVVNHREVPHRLLNDGKYVIYKNRTKDA